MRGSWAFAVIGGVGGGFGPEGEDAYVCGLRAIWKDGAREPGWIGAVWTGRRPKCMHRASMVYYLTSRRYVVFSRTSVCMRTYVRACVRAYARVECARAEREAGCMHKAGEGPARYSGRDCVILLRADCRPARKAGLEVKKSEGWMGGWMEIHGVFLIECTQESPSESRGPRTQQYTKVRIHVSLRRRLTGYHVHVCR